jgi:hypothetical protein
VASAGTLQEGFEAVLARVYARDVADIQADFTRFKIGEGGEGVAPNPIPPDPTFEDILSEGAKLAGGGTATFTNGSPSVVGVGTSFLADVSPGDWIKPGPTYLVEGLKPYSSGDVGSEYDWWGQVQTVVNDLNITLMANYAGATTAVAREVRKASAPLFTFRKTLVAGDVLFTSAVPAITEITAVLLAGEGLLDQLGNAPKYYEVGIFDSNNVLVAYMTFTQEEQTGVQFNHVVEIIW